MNMYVRGEVAGRIGNGPDVRYLQDGTMVVDVSIAVKRKWRKDRSQDENDKAIWYTVTLWGKLGDRFAKAFDEGRLAKGGLVTFQCRNIEPEEYTKRTGEFAYKMTAEANDFTIMVGGVEKAAAEEGSYMANRGNAAGRRRQDATYHKRPEEDYANDIPF
jgi:single stranded DNA-binding protein